MLGACHLIAVDFADEARPLDLWLRVVGKTDVLQKADLRLLQGKVIFNPVLEGDPYERKPVERGRANVGHARSGSDPDFKRDGIKPLHFLRGETRGLDRDFKNDGSRVRIGLDIELEKSNDAANHEGSEEQQDHRPARQPE